MTAIDPHVSAIGAVFDAKADSYDDDRLHRGLAAAVAEFIDVTGVPDALDVATGTGLVLRALARRSAHHSLTGVDISDRMLEGAQRELPSARFLHANGADLPFPDDSFDLLLCVTGLHLFADATSAALEWARVLRARGRIVTATFATGGFGPRVGAPFTVDHESFRTPTAMTQFAGTIGFRVTRHATFSAKEHILLITEMTAGDQNDGQY